MTGSTNSLDNKDTDGIGFAGPFHPEVTWPNKNKNAADAAFDVF
jgi:hypothetical protein